jgi:metal-sulfur cluster biosynthetic enzyme
MEPVAITAQPASLTATAVRDALRDCYHPELSLNLVDLGVIAEIALAPDPTAPGAGIPGVPQRYRVRIVLTPPPAAHDATNIQITAIVCNRLAAFENISGTEVALAETPAWTPDRIAPEARARIAAARSTSQHGLVQIQK